MTHLAPPRPVLPSLVVVLQLLAEVDVVEEMGRQHHQQKQALLSIAQDSSEHSLLPESAMKLRHGGSLYNLTQENLVDMWRKPHSIMSQLPSQISVGALVFE